MNDINALIENYYSWLKDKTIWKAVNNWTEITAPYLDRNNDYIQIYLKKTNEGFLLTDDGNTIASLEEEGCKLDSPKRQELLLATLRGYGVTEDHGEIQITANNIDNFPLAKHSLIQAILSVNDMFYTATPYVMSLFFEDVKDWLDKSKIRYVEKVGFNGLSGYQRTFDFAIPKSSQQPDRLIKTINRPGKSISDSLIMDWQDTKNTRHPETKMYAFINDANGDKPQTKRKTEKNLSESNGALQKDNQFGNDQQFRPAVEKITKALKQYDIRPVLWSQKDKAKDELAA